MCNTTRTTRAQTTGPNVSLSLCNLTTMYTIVHESKIHELDGDRHICLLGWSAGKGPVQRMPQGTRHFESEIRCEFKTSELSNLQEHPASSHSSHHMRLKCTSGTSASVFGWRNQSYQPCNVTLRKFFSLWSSTIDRWASAWRRIEVTWFCQPSRSSAAAWQLLKSAFRNITEPPTWQMLTDSTKVTEAELQSSNSRSMRCSSGVQGWQFKELNKGFSMSLHRRMKFQLYRLNPRYPFHHTFTDSSSFQSANDVAVRLPQFQPVTSWWSSCCLKAKTVQDVIWLCLKQLPSLSKWHCRLKSLYNVAWFRPLEKESTWIAANWKIFLCNEFGKLDGLTMFDR